MQVEPPGLARTAVADIVVALDWSDKAYIKEVQAAVVVVAADACVAIVDSYFKVCALSFAANLYVSSCQGRF